MSLNMVMGWLCCKIQDAGERGKKEANEYLTGMLDRNNEQGMPNKE
jgi:hypothetical protein